MFVVDEFRFDLPDEFRETTVAMWGDGVVQRLSRFAVVLTKKPLDGDTIEALVERDMQALTPRMGIHVLSRGHVPLGNQRVLDVKMRTRPPGTPGFLYQRVVAFQHENHALLLTAGSAMRDRPKCDAHLDAILQTIRFRKR